MLYTTPTTKRQELSEPFDWLGIPALIKRLLNHNHNN